MKPILCVLLSVFVTMGAAQERLRLSLDDALRLGEEQNKAFRASSMTVKAATAREHEVFSSRLPQLKLEAGYRRLSDVDPFEVRVPFSPSPVTISPIVLDNYTMRISLQQPLFTGFSLMNRVRSAEAAAEAAALDNRSDRVELVFNIKSTYWTLFHAIEVRKYIDENVERLQAQLKDAEHLMKAGMATRNDLLAIQLQLANTKLAQIDALNNVSVVMMNLNNLTGHPVNTQIELLSVPGSERMEPMQVKDPESYLTSAVASRPDLKAMEFRLRAAEANLSAVQGSWWPQIYLAGNYYYSRPNPRILPTRDEFKSSWDVGVVLQLDIWNWGATAYQADQAHAQMQQTRLLYDQMKENVILEVRRAWLDVKRSLDKIEVAKIAVEQGQENYRTTDEKYKQGLATTTDLLDASVALLQARTNFSGAAVEHAVALARLERAVGAGEDGGV